MHIEKDKSLKEYNTFGIDVIAKYFLSVKTIEDLKKILKDSAYSTKIVLGGGSNILLTGNLDALVIHVDLKGISVAFEDEDHIHLKVMAGENWQELVDYCLARNYGGIENLSLIPGNTGTAPIQNIGAYGVELKDIFVSCEALSRQTLEIKTFPLEDCEFGYRSSVFKYREKGNYIITSVILKFTKKNHNIRAAYGDIQQELKKMGVEQEPTIQDISKAVITIRKSKLPDPKVLGNSGSFFKNPIISKDEFYRFSNSFPEAPFYKISEDHFKIPAGWLIENAGYKGKRFGDAGVHDKQALVLVNHKNASGKEILELAGKIQSEVEQRFGIRIEPEVNII